MVGVKSLGPAATAVVLATVFAVSSCGDDAPGGGIASRPDGGNDRRPDASHPQPEGGTDAGTLDAFGAWEQIRAALAKSPDHRAPARGG
jgi:hypothetical protein